MIPKLSKGSGKLEQKLVLKIIQIGRIYVKGNEEREEAGRNSKQKKTGCAKTQRQDGLWDAWRQQGKQCVGHRGFRVIHIIKSG